MKTEARRWRSPALGRDMELRLYGHAGTPALVFPSGGGRFFEYEDFGMVEACRPFLEAGRLRLVAVDGIDNETLFDRSAPIPERIRRHERYERYIMEEALPLARSLGGGAPVLTTGCSGGAYHAANFLFRHPEDFGGTIALSGLYGPSFAFGREWDDAIYFHFPLAYMPGLADARALGLLRSKPIVLCVGQGDWETCADYDCLGDTRAMGEVLEAKGIPAWVDVWGPEARHDWEWWRRQMPHFLEKIL